MYKFEVWAYSVDRETGYRDGGGVYTTVELPCKYPALSEFERIFSRKRGWDGVGFIPYSGEAGAEENALDFYAELEAWKERAEENAA